MDDVKLDIAFGEYDRTLILKDGKIKILGHLLEVVEIDALISADVPKCMLDGSANRQAPIRRS